MSPALAHLPGRIRYWMTPVLERVPDVCFPTRERRVHVYGVGMPRSGTVSLYDIFKTRFRSAHEPESRFLTRKVVDWRKGNLDDARMRAYLQRRDRRLGLELDASYLNAEVAPLLADLFPEARFVLTIRTCLSWTDSMMNFLLNKPEFLTARKSHVQEHMAVQFGRPPYSYAPEEHDLAAKRLPPLASFLGYWRDHHRRVAEAIPAERLFVLRTTDLGRATAALEQFVGQPKGSLNEAVHSNAAPRRHSLLDSMPHEFVQAKVAAVCGEEMQRYFPESSEGRG